MPTLFPLAVLEIGPHDIHTDDILYEQFIYLLEHVAEKVEYGCPECNRYLRLKQILLEPFKEAINSGTWKASIGKRKK